MRTGVSKNTAVKLQADPGAACAKFHDKYLRNFRARRLQRDEIWSFVGCRQKNASPKQKAGGWGDVWTWIGADADVKLVVSYLAGGRDASWAMDFTEDCASRGRSSVLRATCAPLRMTRQSALQFGQLCLGFAQGRFESGAADGVGGALVQDALPLQLQGLALALFRGPVPGILRCSPGRWSGGVLALGLLFNLIFYRLALPSSCHIPIVTRLARNAASIGNAGASVIDMKAWRIPSFGIENLQLATVPDPRPQRGEVLVRVHAVSLNFRDLMITLGKYNPKMHLPRIPCSDGAGEVIAVGEGVTRVKAGDRVAGIFMQNWIDGPADAAKIRGALGGDMDGMLAEYVVLREEGLVPVPEHLSWEEAATLPCAGVTAWHAVVHAGQVKAGDTVLIQGTGGVSIFALQFAKMQGARVIGTSGSDEKLARAAKLGLDAGINYRSNPEWDQWVLDQTGGRGVDLVVEVGGAGTFSRSLRALRVGGVVAQIGVLTQSSQPIEIPMLLHRQVHLQGIYVGSRAHFEEMNRAVAQNRMQPVVDEVFSLETFPEGLIRMDRAAHFGKLIVRIPG